MRLADSGVSSCSSESSAGGALGAYGKTTVHLHRCDLHHNTTYTDGGAIEQMGRPQVVLTECSITDNTCRQRGGAVAAFHDSSLQLHNSVVQRNVANVAGQRGGIYLEDSAALGLDHSRIELNKADWGGGVWLSSGNFFAAQICNLVFNNKAEFAQDFRAVPTALINTNSSTIEGFVSRLGTDVGVLNVSLLATGHQGLPSRTTTVQAVVDRVVLSHGVTDGNGAVNLPVKLRKPPGRCCQHVWDAF